MGIEIAYLYSLLGYNFFVALILYNDLQLSKGYETIDASALYHPKNTLHFFGNDSPKIGACSKKCKLANEGCRLLDFEFTQNHL